MRTRNKVVAESLTSYPSTVLGTYECFQVPSGYLSGSSSAAVAPASRYTLREESWMVDQVGGGKRPKDVRHWKCKLVRGSIPTYYCHPGSPLGTGYTRYVSTAARLNAEVAHGVLEPLMATPLLGLIPGVTNQWALEDDRKYVQQLYDRARKPVVDGLLNLVESPEIPSALTALTSYGAEKQRNWKKIMTEWKINRPRYLVKKISVDLANKYLAYSFGIAPLISDATKVHAYLKRVRADYERFRVSQVKRISIVRNGAFAFSKASGVFNSVDINYQGFATQYPVTRYVLTYRERNPYSTEFLSKLDFLLRRFGSAGPASFLWERIPFSFVLDWFIDTSSVLDRLDGLLQADRIETISLTKSRKMVVNVDAFGSVKRSDNNQLVQDYKVGSVETSVYERYVLGKPTYVDLSIRYGKKQAALSAALLRQKLKKL